jgi:predicted N-formylglutamate amidohydrolase
MDSYNLGGWTDSLSLLQRAEAAEQKLVLKTAEADGLGSIMLELQQDCIKEKQKAERYLDLLCEAAPVMWTMTDNSDEAKEWEKKVEKALKEIENE